MTVLRYKLPGALGTVSFADTILAHFEIYKQRKCISREAGGQLFASVHGSEVAITNVTGPRLGDKRSVFNYEPDRAGERIEIENNFRNGLHFVGDWHTHKQRIPVPSSTDLRNIRLLVQESKHDLAGFLLVVVGLEKFPAGLHVSFHTVSDWMVLETIDG